MGIHKPSRKGAIHINIPPDTLKEENAPASADEIEQLRAQMKDMQFHENAERYGYRRIHGLLKREGVILSGKVVRRLMREECLEIKTKRRRKYSSYQGEISPSVPNVLERDFHADRPNEK